INGKKRLVRTFEKDKEIDYSKLTTEEFIKTFKDNRSRDLAKKVLNIIGSSKIIKESISSFESIMKKKNKEYNDGTGVHILLPLAGMSPSGHFYRGYFENHYPNAKISFVLTPDSHQEQNSSNKFLFSENFKKLINPKEDKLVFMFDYVSLELKTTQLLRENLITINNDIEFYAIKGPEIRRGDFLRNYVKWDFGGMNLSDAYRMILQKEGIFENEETRKKAIDTINLALSNKKYCSYKITENSNYNGKASNYFKLKRDEIVKAKTYYYLGKRFNLEKAY
ncbi:MAG: hypothetical protein V1824_01780, partial [archaeon]